MTFPHLMVHDVTIVTPGESTGRYGDTVKDWSSASREEVRGWVARRSQEEVNGHREAQVSAWVLFVEPDVTVTGQDRVEWCDTTFEVDGPPLPAYSPRGQHHMEVPLRLVEG